jgi:hypothetical protein
MFYVLSLSPFALMRVGARGDEAGWPLCMAEPGMEGEGAQTNVSPKPLILLFAPALLPQPVS